MSLNRLREFLGKGDIAGVSRGNRRRGQRPIDRAVMTLGMVAALWSPSLARAAGTGPSKNQPQTESIKPLPPLAIQPDFTQDQLNDWYQEAYTLASIPKTQFSKFIETMNGRFRGILGTPDSGVVIVDPEPLLAGDGIAAEEAGDRQAFRGDMNSYLWRNAKLLLPPSELDVLINALAARDGSSIYPDELRPAINRHSQMKNACVVFPTNPDIDGKRMMADFALLNPAALKPIGGEVADLNFMQYMAIYHEVGHCQDAHYLPALHKIEVAEDAFQAIEDARAAMRKSDYPPDVADAQKKIADAQQALYDSGAAIEAQSDSVGVDKAVLTAKAESFADTYASLLLAQEGFTDFAGRLADLRILPPSAKGRALQHMCSSNLLTSFGYYNLSAGVLGHFTEPTLRAVQAYVDKTGREAIAKMTNQQLLDKAFELVESSALNADQTIALRGYMLAGDHLIDHLKQRVAQGDANAPARLAVIEDFKKRADAAIEKDVYADKIDMPTYENPTDEKPVLDAWQGLIERAEAHGGTMVAFAQQYAEWRDEMRQKIAAGQGDAEQNRVILQEVMMRMIVGDKLGYDMLHGQLQPGEKAAPLWQQPAPAAPPEACPNRPDAYDQLFSDIDNGKAFIDWTRSLTITFSMNATPQDAGKPTVPARRGPGM